jgi:hypothetical protein
MTELLVMGKLLATVMMDRFLRFLKDGGREGEEPGQARLSSSVFELERLDRSEEKDELDFDRELDRSRSTGDSNAVKYSLASVAGVAGLGAEEGPEEERTANASRKPKPCKRDFLNATLQRWFGWNDRIHLQVLDTSVLVALELVRRSCKSRVDVSIRRYFSVTSSSLSTS